MMGLQNAIAEISGISADRIFVVRKLHRLAALSSDPVSDLRLFFSSFGLVSKILLLPSRRRCGRLRPSTTGFVVMASSAAVLHVLKAAAGGGGVLLLPGSGASVEVTPFEFPSSADGGCDAAAWLQQHQTTTPHSPASPASSPIHTPTTNMSPKFFF